MSGSLPNAPKGVTPFSHCSDCEEFLDRYDIAEQINQLFGTTGSWDFATCYRSCIKKYQKEEIIHRNRVRESYHRMKAGAV